MTEVSTRPPVGANDAPITSTPVAASAPVENEALKPENNPESIFYGSATRQQRPSPDNTTPTTIVLHIVPAEPTGSLNFKDDARREAGLQMFNGIDTVNTFEDGRPAAYFDYRQWDMWKDQLKLITVTVDPQQCSFQHCLGEVIMQAAARVAKVSGGKVCDSAGKVLSEMECEALAAYIDGQLAARLKARRRQEFKDAERLECGHRRVPGPLPFTATIRDAQNRDAWQESFNAPALPYYEGRALGATYALEFFKHLQRQSATGYSRLLVHRVLVEAFELSAKADPAGETAGNVADEFVTLACEAVLWAARSGFAGDWMKRRALALQEVADQIDRFAAKRKAEFVDRMKAAKRAKRQGGAA